jgi:hypothetical protein
MSRRTGPLRAGRPLRGVYTGLGGGNCTGPPVGRADDCEGRMFALTAHHSAL